MCHVPKRGLCCSHDQRTVSDAPPESSAVDPVFRKRGGGPSALASRKAGWEALREGGLCLSGGPRLPPGGEGAVSIAVVSGVHWLLPPQEGLLQGPRVGMGRGREAPTAPAAEPSG